MSRLMRLTCPSYFISKRSCRAPGCWEFLDRTGCRQQYICGSLPGYLGCKLSIQRPDKSLRTCKTIAQTPNEQLSKITAVFGDVVSSTQSTVSSFTAAHHHRGGIPAVRGQIWWPVEPFCFCLLCWPAPRAFEPGGAWQ